MLGGLGRVASNDVAQSLDQARGGRVDETIVGRLGLAAPLDDPLLAQPRQMLRAGRLREPRKGGQFVHPGLSGAQPAQEDQPLPVREQAHQPGGLRGLGLKPSERTRPDRGAHDAPLSVAGSLPFSAT